MRMSAKRSTASGGQALDLGRRKGWMTTLALAAALLAGSGLEAQEVAHTQFIPVVAHAAGLGGTQWLSDLTVYNLTDSELVVGTQFLPADQANAFNPTFPDRFTLQPGETLLIEDVLGTLYGYTEDIVGSLFFTVDNLLIPTNPAGATILASTRTYNAGSPDGTYGQTILSNSRTINASGTKSIITGARNDDRFRSNLGIVSMALFNPITIHYQVLNANHDVVAEGSKSMPPSSLSQVSFSSLGVPKEEGPLTVELWLDPDDVFPDPCVTQYPNMFLAYVSKVDGNPDGTGDAEFIYSSPVEPYDCYR